MEVHNQPATFSLPLTPKEAQAQELKERAEADLLTLKNQYSGQGSDRWEGSSPEYQAKVEARVKQYSHDYNELFAISKPMSSILDALRKELSQRGK